MQAMDVDSFGQDDDLKDQLGSSLKETLDTSEVHGKVAPSGTEATHTEPEKKVGKVFLSNYCINPTSQKHPKISSMHKSILMVLTSLLT